LKDFIELPVELVARGPVTPERWLGQTPILDIFTTTMVLLGLYLYFYKRALDRVKLIGICILFGFVMVSLNGVSWITLILPFICMLSTAGIGLMLQQWFTVFPRNPLAKVVGLAFLTLTISMASYYQVSRYFVAWAEAPETKAIYSQNVLDE
jgi:membrane-bound ClpP family serine protease